MNYQQRKAQLVAKVVNSGFYDYFGKCYKKNNHYYIYDFDELRIKPISISKLAQQFKMVLTDVGKDFDFDFQCDFYEVYTEHKEDNFNSARNESYIFKSMIFPTIEQATKYLEQHNLLRKDFNVKFVSLIDNIDNFKYCPIYNFLKGVGLCTFQDMK